MSKIHIDRLAKSLGLDPKDIRGIKYEKLVQAICVKNSENISKKVTKINQDEWSRAMDKIGTKEKRFIVPSLNDVMSRNNVSIRKSAENGTLISNTLHEGLVKTLNRTMQDFTEKTGEMTYVARRGKTAGKINVGLIEKFEQNLTKTFQNYTKKDPEFGMPTNVHTIAVTEMRSTINTANHLYVETLNEKNPDLIMQKVWVHNGGLSKESRPGHEKVAQQTARKPIDVSEFFEIPYYFKYKGKWRKGAGTISMQHPHSGEGGPEEEIGCNCEVRYVARRKK